MHGRPRKAQKPEEEAASAVKAEKLRSLQANFLFNHQNKIYTKEAVELSAKLLEINPEMYTAWNYRKLAVEHNLDQSQPDPGFVKSIMDEELRVVESALRQNFKSYGAWHHRKWVLSKGNSSMDNELRLLEKFQRADARNFHAWNYRRFVVELMNRSKQDELKYAEDMINNNFSNYSAWHNRSVLLSELLEKMAEEFPANEKVPEEYEFVHQAIFTDPDDQSGWFHHRWLLDQTTKPESPLLVSSWPSHGSSLTFSRALCTDHSSSPFTSFCSGPGTFPLVLCFNQAVGGVNSSTVTIESELIAGKDIVWNPLPSRTSRFSHIWVAHLNLCNFDLSTSKDYPLKVNLRHSQGIFSSSGLNFSHPSEYKFMVHVNSAERVPSEEPFTNIVSWTGEKFHSWETQPQELQLIDSFNQLRIKNEQDSTDADWRLVALQGEIECFRELLSLTDSKIGKLTLARLLSAYDMMRSRHAEMLLSCEEVLQLYTDLMKMDPPHYHYYKDEFSIALLRQVTSNGDSLIKHLFHHRDMHNTVFLRLNNLSISRIGSVDKLLWVQTLDLSHNEIRSTEGLEALQLLSCLNLSSNKLCSFSALESLRYLKHLKVLNISHNEIGEHSIDTTRYLSSSPLSHSVGKEWLLDDFVSGEEFPSDYWAAFFTFRDSTLLQLDTTGNAISDEKFRSFLVKVVPTLIWLDGQKLTQVR